MKTVLDILITTTIKATLWVLSHLPYEFAVKVTAFLIRFCCFFLSRHVKIADRNMQIVFPDYSSQQRRELFRAHQIELARLLVDFARAPILSTEWLKEHIDYSALDLLTRVRPDQSKPGAIIVTGHLSSFELLAVTMGRVHRTFAFVARDFELPRLNKWWRKQRECCGNLSIGRNGAFKESTQTLARGIDVALLFDQNVKQNHAVFVPFCGVLAATSKTPAIVALRARAPIVAIGIEYSGKQRYAIKVLEVQTADIYSDSTSDFEAKVLALTARSTAAFEVLLRGFPSGWFWMHRRWKTRPAEQPVSIY